MAEYLIEDSTLEDIADSIRAKDGTSADIQVSDYAQRIQNIPSEDTLKGILENTLEEFTIPNDITVLKDYIFDGCTNLTVSGLEHLTEIKQNALYQVKNKKFNLLECITLGTRAINTNLNYSNHAEEIYLPKATSIQSFNGYISGQIKGSLVKFVARAVTSIGSEQYRANANLVHMYLPKITTVGSRPMQYCDSLKEACVSGTSVVTNMYANCFDLEMLVISNSTPSTLADINAFNNTKIQNGTGYIYVPRATISTYEGMTNWSVVKDYAQDGTFKAIEDNLTLIENTFEYFREDHPQFYE